MEDVVVTVGPLTYVFLQHFDDVARIIWQSLHPFQKRFVAQQFNIAKLF